VNATYSSGLAELRGKNFTLFAYASGLWPITELFFPSCPRVSARAATRGIARMRRRQFASPVIEKTFPCGEWTRANGQRRWK